MPSDTLEQRAEMLHKETVNILKKLDVIWDEIGLDAETRQKRHNMFYEHVVDLYNDMLVEAEEIKTSIFNNIEQYGQELTALSRDMRLNLSIESYEGIPLYTIKQDLKTKLEKYQQLYKSQLSEINNLLSHQKILCHALGKKPKELPTKPLPTKEELDEFRGYLEELSDLKFRREETFLSLKSEIVETLKELKIEPKLDFERKVVLCEDSTFRVTDENMNQLESWHKSLNDELRETKIQIEELREKISNLWELLEESPQIRSAFLEAHSGNSISTLLELREELHKLEARKKANIKLFVDKLRRELEEWWKKCCKSPEEQAEFLYFYSDCYTEDLLTFHEMEIEKLKTLYENNIGIYNLYSRRETLWEHMQNLEHRASQPDRYKNRGGQLLNEEKERKSVAKQLPKIEQELLELVADFESCHGAPFLIHGKRVSDLLTASWEKYKRDKQFKLSTKKKLREEATPNLVLTSCSRVTPSISCSKRKLETPLSTSSKRSRLGTLSTTKSSSRIHLISSSFKKMSSADRQRRLQRIRRRSKMALQSDTTNYENFQGELENKASCRSSHFPEEALLSIKKETPSINPQGTPRRALLTVNNTPQRTPLRSALRPKSPTALTSRLAAAPNDLPCIF